MPNMRWAENLVVTAHADMAAAELILEPPIDPLGPRAHDVATLLGKDETERAPRLLLLLQRLLHVDRAAGFTSTIGLWPSKMLCAQISIES